MNVAEMHRRVNMSLDKINSMQADTLLAEEIDVALNMAQEQFIKSRYNRANKYGKGFEESQKRIDDLANLILDAQLTAIASESLGNGYWRDIYVPLEQDAEGDNPIEDYMFLVSLKTEVQYVDCKYKLVEDIDYAFYDPGSIIEGLEPSELVDTNGNPLGPLANFNAMVLWQSYLHIADVPPRVLLETTMDDTGNIIIPKQLKHKISLCKYVQNDDVYTLLEDPFNTVTVSGPFYTFGAIQNINSDVESNSWRNKIEIYTNDTFFTTNAYMRYIRKPQDIRLNEIIIDDETTLPTMDCGLLPHTHQEIVNIAVDILLEGISDPRYKTHQMETMKSD